MELKEEMIVYSLKTASYTMHCLDDSLDCLKPLRKQLENLDEGLVDGDDGFMYVFFPKGSSDGMITLYPYLIPTKNLTIADGVYHAIVPFVNGMPYRAKRNISSCHSKKEYLFI